MGGESASVNTLLPGYRPPTRNCSQRSLLCFRHHLFDIKSNSFICSPSWMQEFIFLPSIRFVLKALNETVKYLTAFLNHVTQNSILKFFEW